ncbi:MAG: hypothetical protein PUB96_02005 [Helicobacteraceae bacterium]|nr:hypothetical protein [Helicobacteraceae bacterium]
MKLAFFCTGSGAFLKFIYKNLEILVESKKDSSATITDSAGGGGVKPLFKQQ